MGCKALPPQGSHSKHLCLGEVGKGWGHAAGEVLGVSRRGMVTYPEVDQPNHHIVKPWTYGLEEKEYRAPLYLTCVYAGNGCTAAYMYVSRCVHVHLKK